MSTIADVTTASEPKRIKQFILCYSKYSGTSEQRTVWDQYKFKWFVPCIEVVLFERFQSHYIDRGDKIWGFSFVHW